MLTTVFSGAAVIVVLFYGLRLFKLPAYWCSVISASIPLLAYFFFASRDWPGLDVVAMHVTVFIATAFVLNLINARRRAGNEKLHWAPKIFIGFFLALFLVLGGFAYMATNGLPESIARYALPNGMHGGVHTAFPGVVPHGEEAAKGISEHLKQQYQKNLLGWQVSVVGLERLTLDQSAEITVRVRDRAGAPLTGADVQLVLSRPARRDADLVIPLSPGVPGTYHGTLRLTAPGQWTALLRVEHGTGAAEFEQPFVSVVAP